MTNTAQCASVASPKLETNSTTTSDAVVAWLVVFYMLAGRFIKTLLFG